VVSRSVGLGPLPLPPAAPLLLAFRPFPLEPLFPEPLASFPLAEEVVAALAEEEEALAVYPVGAER
jgi:hypothetical protein